MSGEISKWGVPGVTETYKSECVRSDIYGMAGVCIWRYIKVGRVRSDIHGMAGVSVFDDISK